MVDVRDQDPPSPCIRNCCLDLQDTCIGCLRTLQEIRDWHTATTEEKISILERCAARRQARFPQQGPRQG